jgi:hypothetical protein
MEEESECHALDQHAVSAGGRYQCSPNDEGEVFESQKSERVKKNDSASTVRQSYGLSKRGLMKAFDIIGHDEKTSNIDSITSTVVASSPVLSHEADQLSSRHNVTQEGLSSTTEKMGRSVDVQTTKRDRDETRIFDQQSSLKYLIVILLGLVWWLARWRVASQS